MPADSAMQGTRPATHVTTLRAEAAAALLDDATFGRRWDNLWKACSWSTVFQSRPFADAWYRTYAGVYEPVVSVAEDGEGELVGLLTLAFDPRSRRLFAAGAQFAEYQCWLAVTEHAATFMPLAWEALSSIGADDLTLRYLPPDIPVTWTALKPSRTSFVVGEVPRPLMDVGPNCSAAASLKKKSNRSRFARLRRSGPVTFERLTDATLLRRDLSRIADFCDLRHGAINDVLPFRDDPRQAPFLERCMTIPDLMHVTVIRSNDDLVSAQLNFRDRNRLVLGTIAHSPHFAEHSPGKLHILLLAQDLHSQGIDVFDLTPGADPYKERFATHADQVRTMKILFNRRALVRHAFSTTLRRHAIFIAQHAKLAGPLRTTLSLLRAHPPSEAIGRVRASMHRLAARSLVASALRLGKGSSESRDLPDASDSAVDAIPDLLKYRVGGRWAVRRQEFLRECLARIERGERFATMTRGEELLAVCWIASTVHESRATASLGENMSLKYSRTPPHDIGLLLRLAASTRPSPEQSGAECREALVGAPAVCARAPRLEAGAPAADRHVGIRA